jgi:ribosome production factor 1
MLCRYVFPEERGGTKARLQEIGPRFTLKLKSLQTGAFDSNRGEYEWINLAENDKKKRKFAL